MTNNGIRKLSVWADATQIAQERRIRIRGSGNMTLMPDFYMVDIYNPDDNDLGALSGAKNLTVRGESGTTLCYGEIADTYSRTEGVNDILTIAVEDGKSFWEARVSVTLGGGSDLKSTMRNIMKGASMGPYLAKETRLVRGQTYSGRLAECVSMLAKSANARAFVTTGVVFVVTPGQASEIVDVSENDVTGETSYANGVAILKMPVQGYNVGIMVRYGGKTYRLVSRKVSADNFKGDWDLEMVLVDEALVGASGMEGG